MSVVVRCDEVMVQQQPRGSYTLEVFKGYLAIGGGYEVLTYYTNMSNIKISSGSPHGVCPAIPSASQYL